MHTIHPAPRRAVALRNATPIDHATIAQMRLGDARITLAGTLTIGDYRKLLAMRADALASAAALRRAAGGGMFAHEYAIGARQASRAAQLLGRANFLHHSIINGEPTAAEWRRFELAATGLLRRAQTNLDQAYIAAYTGTHP